MRHMAPAEFGRGGWCHLPFSHEWENIATESGHSVATRFQLFVTNQPPLPFITVT